MMRNLGHILTEREMCHETQRGKSGPYLAGNCWAGTGVFGVLGAANRIWMGGLDPDRHRCRGYVPHLFDPGRQYLWAEKGLTPFLQKRRRATDGADLVWLGGA